MFRRKSYKRKTWGGDRFDPLGNGRLTFKKIIIAIIACHCTLFVAFKFVHVSYLTNTALQSVSELKSL